MKLKVIKRYADKYTKELVLSDMILKDVPEWRSKKLLEAGVA